MFHFQDTGQVLLFYQVIGDVIVQILVDIKLSNIGPVHYRKNPGLDNIVAAASKRPICDLQPLAVKKITTTRFGNYWANFSNKIQFQHEIDSCKPDLLRGATSRNPNGFCFLKKLAQEPWKTRASTASRSSILLVQTGYLSFADGGRLHVFCVSFLRNRSAGKFFHTSFQLIWNHSGGNDDAIANWGRATRQALLGHSFYYGVANRTGSLLMDREK